MKYLIISSFMLFSKFILTAQMNPEALTDINKLEEGIALEDLFDKETDEIIKTDKIFIKWNIPLSHQLPALPTPIKKPNIS